MSVTREMMDPFVKEMALAARVAILRAEWWEEEWRKGRQHDAQAAFVLQDCLSYLRALSRDSVDALTREL